MTSPVTIVCVNVGPKYPMEYVAILRDMVTRHLPTGQYTFACLTDRPDELPAGVLPLSADPALPGWWQKVKLFDPALGLSGRIVYFDLDVAITGRLDDLIATPGIIQDWHYPAYNSSVMVWDAGDHADIWSRFTPADMERPSDLAPGAIWTDQDWMYRLGGWNTFPSAWCVSYRSHAVAWPPRHASVVCFHGEPKPHQVKDGWVPQSWKIGGMYDLRIVGAPNVVDEKIKDHIRVNCARSPMRWYIGRHPHDEPIMIVGGSPSVKGLIPSIKRRHQAGAHIMAVNGSAAFLRSHGIIPDVHVILDARPENIAFLADPHPHTFHLLASQCDPSLFDHLAAKSADVGMWHAMLYHGHEREISELARGRPWQLIPGGSTVMLRSMFLAATSGCQTMHIYGMDSSFAGRTHHAYDQHLNAADEPMSIVWRGKSYQAAPWMIRQATEFQDDHWIPLTKAGGRIFVHGDGLIPDICQYLNRTLNKGRKAA